MVSAAVAALLYGPARQRLALYANRLVYGEREAPDAVLRTFGSRLSRAIPMDELLLQVAESLRKTPGAQQRRGLDGCATDVSSARSRARRPHRGSLALSPKRSRWWPGPA